MLSSILSRTQICLLLFGRIGSKVEVADFQQTSAFAEDGDVDDIYLSSLHVRPATNPRLSETRT
jgi:hypothetical protein